MASANWRCLSVKRNRHLVSAARAGDSLQESPRSHCFLFSILFCPHSFLFHFFRLFSRHDPLRPSWNTTRNPSTTTKTTSSQATARRTPPMMTQTIATWCIISKCSHSHTRLCRLACLVCTTCSPATLHAVLISDRASPASFTGQLSDTEMQQAISYQRNLNMMGQQPYTNNVYNASPPHGALPLSGSPPPPSPSHLYDPLSPHVSGSDTSADGIYHHSRNSSATGSPSSSRANSLVHRHPLRYNPTPSPTSSSAGRRSRGNSLSDDDDVRMGIGMAESLANTRKEATRRQRIEAEQRRRDELRDGYARLKDALPVSNQKSSKVSLLERGGTFSIYPLNCA